VHVLAFLFVSGASLAHCSGEATFECLLRFSPSSITVLDSLRNGCSRMRRRFSQCRRRHRHDTARGLPVPSLPMVSEEGQMDKKVREQSYVEPKATNKG